MKLLSDHWTIFVNGPGQQDSHHQAFKIDRNLQLFFDRFKLTCFDKLILFKPSTLDKNHKYMNDYGF